MRRPSGRGAAAQPEGQGFGLHRPGNDGEQAGVQAIQVDFMLEVGAELGEDSLGVVFAAVEAAVNSGLHVAAHGVEEGDDQQGGALQDAVRRAVCRSASGCGSAAFPNDIIGSVNALDASERRAAVGRICRKHGVDVLYAFGSRATEVRAWLAGQMPRLSASSSDVDFGVKAPPGERFTVDDKVRLALALEDLLAVPRADLVAFQDADPFLAANIVRGERLFAQDPHRADEFDLYILRRAGDMAPLERERMALILGDQV